MYETLSILISTLCDRAIDPIARFLYGLIYHFPYRVNGKWYIIIQGYPLMTKDQNPKTYRIKFCMDLTGPNKNIPIIVRPNEKRRFFYISSIKWFNSYLKRAWNSDNDGKLFQDDNGDVVFYNILKQYRMTKIKHAISAFNTLIVMGICGWIIPSLWKIHRREFINGETILEIILTLFGFSIVALMIGTVYIYFLEQDRFLRSKDRKLNRTFKNVYNSWFYELR